MRRLSTVCERRALTIAFAAVACDYVATGMMRTVLPFYARRISQTDSAALSSNLLVGALEATVGT